MAHKCPKCGAESDFRYRHQQSPETHREGYECPDFNCPVVTFSLYTDD